MLWVEGPRFKGLGFMVEEDRNTKPTKSSSRRSIGLEGTKHKVRILNPCSSEAIVLPV